jgi:signal transduction histidine kinase
MNKVLERQLKNIFGGVENVPKGLEDFIKLVNDTYNHAEEDRQMIERSLEVSSKELGELNKKTIEESEKLKISFSELERSKAAILNLLEDIDEEKKKVEAVVIERTKELSAEKARLLASINSIPFGFTVVDNDSRIILKNSVFTEMFKVDDSKDLYIKDIANILGKNSDIESVVAECVKGKTVCEIKEIVFDKKILRGIIAPIVTLGSDGSSIGFVFLLEDITDAKALERSRDEFFSIASHELRTPLTAIRGNAEMLKDNYKDKMADADMGEMIGDIHQSAIHLIDIVNDFLEVSRLEQGRIEIKREKFDLSELILKTMKNMEEMTKQKGISIIYSPEDNKVPPVCSDKGRVEQILFNLLGNSVKFTSKGSITIKVEQIGGFIKTSVIDTGLGISEANQGLLFRKFQQASENVLARDVTQGTGLGLYICSLIVSKLGGSIGLESSELGKGSTFVFTLPVAA